MMRCVEKARPLLDCKYVMFFEVLREEDEAIADVCRELRALDCTVIEDDAHDRIVAMPKSQGREASHPNAARATPCNPRRSLP
jgi:hypothetical protein